MPTFQPTPSDLTILFDLFKRTYPAEGAAADRWLFLGQTWQLSRSVSRKLMHNVYLSMDYALRKVIRFTQTLMILSVDGRLAATLLYLSKLSADAKKPDEFEMPISQAELANWLGASRGHLNRA